MDATVMSFAARSVLVTAVLLAAGEGATRPGRVVFTANQHQPSLLFINEAAGSTRARKLTNQIGPGKGSTLYELILYPAKEASRTVRATATLEGRISGRVNFIQTNIPVGPVVIEGSLDDVSQGAHRISIHEFGDLSDGCNSVGELFNPYGMSHGRLDDPSRSLGDIMEFEVQDSFKYAFRQIDRHLSLTGRRSIVGRTLVVTDDRGQRVGCGVIGHAK